MGAATAADRSLRPLEDESRVCLSPVALQEEATDAAVARTHPRSDVTAVKTGLSFSPQTRYETWEAMGAKLGGRSNSACWWLGDWLLFGERNYLRYRDAIDATGLDYQTLRNYAAVARRFPLSRRRDNLSFQHHAAVAALPDEEQEHWLNLGASYSWSLHTLRSRLRRARDPGRGDPDRMVRFQVDATREERWRTTASANGVSLQRWIIETLDAAAREGT